MYKTFGLSYIPPELAKTPASLKRPLIMTLPELIEADDIHRRLSLPHDLQRRRQHSRRHGGGGQGARLEYLGLADHSQSLTVANGLSAECVRHQQAAIDDRPNGLKGINLFKGTECDILADGSLDYDDDVLATFDYVVASVHSHFDQSRTK